MTYSEVDIVELIKKIVFDVTKIEIISSEENLLSTKLDINPVDFLYIFDELEKRLNIPVVEIFVNSDYSVLKVNILGKKLYEMCQRDSCTM